MWSTHLSDEEAKAQRDQEALPSFFPKWQSRVSILDMCDRNVPEPYSVRHCLKAPSTLVYLAKV